VEEHPGRAAATGAGCREAEGGARSPGSGAGERGFAGEGGMRGGKAVVGSDRRTHVEVKGTGTHILTSKKCFIGDAFHSNRVSYG